MTVPPDTTEVAVLVARALEAAGVEYAVGGSLASSAFGEPRATRDIDVAIRLVPDRVAEMIAAFGPDFSIDTGALHEAVRTEGILNIFYLPELTKVDLFVRGDDVYDREEFSRRVQIEPVPGQSILASSREDNLLWKLRWYRQGGEISDQQWRDVLGLLRIGGDLIDLSYLRTWAAYHDISDLLDRALQQRAV
ncbi:MAG: hypothetical protein WA208_11880 [Thermoanaerobaculia bacterium]